MRAIAVTPGQKGSARLSDLPKPERQSGEYLVRVLEVGVDGTDRELDAGEYGSAPPGEDVLIIGHESLGEVVEACPGEDCFQVGNLVVATVRRPDPKRCLHCRNGEYDFCLHDDYRERGIKDQHGYMAEFYAERPEFLVSVPAELRDVAVMLEPMSVVQKAFRMAQRIQQRMSASEMERTLITGAGAIGIFAALLSRLRGMETLVYSRGPAGMHGEILEIIGARYVDAEKQSLPEAVKDFGAPNFVIEATGFSPLAWQAAELLNRNGVLCLLSVTGGDRHVDLDSDHLNQVMVLGNRLMFGSVSSDRLDFEQGVRDMQTTRERWPGLLERFISRRLPMEDIRAALDEHDPDVLKTVIEVAPAEVRRATSPAEAWRKPARTRADV